MPARVAGPRADQFDLSPGLVTSTKLHPAASCWIGLRGRRRSDILKRSDRSVEEKLDDRDSVRKGKGVSGAASGAGCFRRCQCMGWRIGPDDGRARVYGARDLERRLGRLLGRRDGRVTRDEALAQARL